MDWQPISTAPRDGTPFLLYRDGKIGFGYIEPQQAGGIEWDNTPAAWIGPDAWAKGRTIVSMGGYNSDEATHWMPLPPPPGEA